MNLTNERKVNKKFTLFKREVTGTRIGNGRLQRGGVPGRGGVEGRRGGSLEKSGARV